jgi:hypothetical protein
LANVKPGGNHRGSVSNSPHAALTGARSATVRTIDSMTESLARPMGPFVGSLMSIKSAPPARADSASAELRTLMSKRGIVAILVTAFTFAMSDVTHILGAAAQGPSTNDDDPGTAPIARRRPDL